MADEDGENSNIYVAANGRIWRTTGGNTPAREAAANTPAVVDRKGLNKLQQLMAAAEPDEDELDANPSFPYIIKGYNRTFFKARTSLVDGKGGG